MRQYQVQAASKRPILQAIYSAVELSGGAVIREADASVAPFDMEIDTPQGERLRLIVYAFLANEYRQRNRPVGEHRFQLKYGSDKSDLHQLHIADRPDEVTLMLGVHLDLGLFIAVDPSMHEWTRFFKSVEFKQEDLETACNAGWHGWERERSTVRRHTTPPRESMLTESLLAFRPEHFLRFVNFERIGTGLPTGERLLLADRLSTDSASAGKHPLEIELGLDAATILDMIGGAFRLKAAVRGSTAEFHLKQHLETLSDLEEVESLDEDGKPDFRVRYRKRDFLIECKNVLRKTTAAGACRVDFQKTRASKNDPCSRFYKPDQFAVLAACLHSVTESWEFRFVGTSSLAEHRRCAGHLSNLVVVEGDAWSDSPIPAISSLV